MLKKLITVVGVIGCTTTNYYKHFASYFVSLKYAVLLSSKFNALLLCERCTIVTNLGLIYRLYVHTVHFIKYI